MKQITKESEIHVGKYYYLRDINDDTALPELEQAMFSNDGLKYFKSRIWALDDNPQAFSRWNIYGPVEISIKLAL